MNIKIKEEIDKTMIKRGNVKGEVLRDHFLYIEEREGDEGVEKMEKLLEDYGYPLKFSEIKSLDWYKDAYCGVILLLLSEFFNWENEDFYKMGDRVTKYSFIVTKIMLRYLVSLEKVLKEAPKLWRKHLNFGELEVVELNREKKYFLLKIKDYDIHPLTCHYQRGYYKGLFSYVIKGKNVEAVEEKCIYRGDPFHLYKIKWN